LGVDRTVEQRLQLRGVEEQHPLLPQEGQGVGPADGQEMLAILLQLLGQRRSGVVRFLRLLRIDDRDQQIAKLREIALEQLGALTPGQARRKHLVGVGVDAEMAGGVPAGENGEKNPRQNDPQSVASAVIHQADEQALKRHRGPWR
jgi:hypothetical protein